LHLALNALKGYYKASRLCCIAVVLDDPLNIPQQVSKCIRLQSMQIVKKVMPHTLNSSEPFIKNLFGGFGFTIKHAANAMNHVRISKKGIRQQRTKNNDDEPHLFCPPHLASARCSPSWGGNSDDAAEAENGLRSPRVLRQPMHLR
jgi:hypothetical protein